jgi:ribosomal protein S18 acetylase RimI-like enzyme
VTITVQALETVMADGWRAVEEDHLGDWLLRASSGFTQRGNSALTLGRPGIPLAPAIGIVEQWYAARSLPARFCLLTDADGGVTDHALHDELLARGYHSASATRTMIGACADLPQLTEASPGVVADVRLSPAWLSGFAAYRSIVPGPAEAIFIGSRSQLFLSIPDDTHADGRPAAIARLSIYPGWAGLHAMWVAPDRRRRGLATTIVAAVAHVGREHRMPQVYLQVEHSNKVARAAYQGMGFRDHHGHVYLAKPVGGSSPG